MPERALVIAIPEHPQFAVKHLTGAIAKRKRRPDRKVGMQSTPTWALYDTEQHTVTIHPVILTP